MECSKINALSRSQSKILNTMLCRAGEIIRLGHDGALAVVPRGDRRCRPIGWVGADDLQSLLAQGMVVRTGDNYTLATSYRRRAVARSVSAPPHQKIDTAQTSDSLRTFAAQHSDSATRQIYHPDGIARPTQIVRGVSGLDILLRMKDRAGHRYYDTHELEAATQFVSDYGRAQMAAVATQNYSGVNGGSRRNRAEDISISAMDARNRLMAALTFVGPGLSQSLEVLRDTDVSLGALERSQNWARGSGKTVLKLALTRLSDFYGTQVGMSVKP